MVELGWGRVWDGVPAQGSPLTAPLWLITLTQVVQQLFCVVEPGEEGW